MSGDQSHWRDYSRTPRFFGINGYASISIVIWLFYISWLTTYITVATILFFVILEKFHFTPIVFYRWFKTVIAGPVRISKPWFKE